MNNKTRNIVYAAIIAALYVVLTEFAALLGLSSGAIQIRFSEALNALCLFTPYGIPGMFIGCLLANMLTGAVVFDVVFGSVATLLGAVGVYLFRKHKVLALLCPVVTNALILPFVLKYAYGLPEGTGYFVITIGIGQLVSCTVLGYFFARAVDKHKNYLFK